MKNLKNELLVLFSLIIWLITNTQLLGPTIPCPECVNYTARTEPFNGMWYNPDQSGTGFGIDVQDGKLFGAYYGFDEQGKQIWLTFVGDLVPSEEQGIMWTLEAGLTQFVNGNAFSQTYSAPNTTDYNKTIKLKFTQKNHATFSVDNAEAQNIIPIIFGVPKTIDFPEQTSYQFPDLTGLWTFVYYFQIENIEEKYATVSEVLYIDDKFFIDVDSDGLLDVNYIVIQYDGHPVIIGSIVCKLNQVNNKITRPTCVFTHAGQLDPPLLIPDIEYQMSLGGLGAFRLFGQRPDGTTFEAIKINSKIF